MTSFAFKLITITFATLFLQTLHAVELSCKGVLTKVNLEPQSHKEPLPEIGANPLDNYRLTNIQVGILSEQEFNKWVFELGQSNLLFKEGKSFNLNEILPPLLQNLDGFYVKDKVINLTPEQMTAVHAGFANEGTLVNGVHLTPNCHSLSFNWVKHKISQNRGESLTEADLFNLDGWDLKHILEEVASEVEFEVMRPGDIIMINGMGGGLSGGASDPAHSAVYIGKGLVFEKGDTAEVYPYRIIKLEDMLKKYQERQSLSVYRVSKDQKEFPLIPAIGNNENFSKEVRQDAFLSRISAGSIRSGAAGYQILMTYSSSLKFRTQAIHDAP